MSTNLLEQMLCVIVCVKSDWHTDINGCYVMLHIGKGVGEIYSHWQYWKSSFSITDNTVSL
jgi:hypothetical protein